MSDGVSDEGSDINQDQDDTQEELMTPAELIAKLEEVRSFQHRKPRVVFLATFCKDFRARELSHVETSVNSPSVSRCVAVCWQAWLNEKFSPELLDNKSEVVECVMEQLTHMVP